MINLIQQKDDVNISKMYGKDATLSKTDFLKQYNVKDTGISSQEAENLIQKYGLNEIKQSKQKKWYNYFLESLFTPFNCILLRNHYSSFLHRCFFATNT